MEVKFADSFYDSLKSLSRRERWWYKVYETLRYNIPNFFRNVYSFRKELYDYRSFDWHYQIALLRRGLELNADYLENFGYEVEGPRMKKVKSIRRAVEIIKIHENDCFLELAEEELGYKYRTGDISSGNLYDMFNLDDETERINSLISDRSRVIERKTWDELFQILKGQDVEEFRKIISDNTLEEKDNAWDNWFDGTGMKGWWD